MEKKRKRLNYFTCNIPAKSVNEGFARGIISAFCAQLDPTVEELCDMKTAISEAVTNCIVHAYAGENDEKKKKILLKAEYFDDGLLSVSIKDYGCGIEDIEKAMQEGYSTASEEARSLGFGAGMGLPNMKKYTDTMQIESTVGVGTTVRMTVLL